MNTALQEPTSQKMHVKSLSLIPENALKKMDKSITLQELNEKLTKTVAEPDAPDADSEEDLDV